MSPRLDRQAAFSGTADVRPPHRFDAAALAAYLADHVEGFAGPLTVSQFKGGQSNPTYKLVTPRATMCCGASRRASCCRRRHAVEREYRVTGGAPSRWAFRCRGRISCARTAR